MKKKFFVVLCGLILLTGCGKVPKLKDGKEVVASIDGYDLTAEELYEKLKENGGTSVVVEKIDSAIIKQELGDSKDAEDYADSLIKSLKEQAELYEMDFETEVVQQYYGYNDEKSLRDAMILSYQKNQVLENYLSDKLTDEEINEYYENEIDGEMDVKHILIKPEVTDEMTDEEKENAENEALEKAKSLIAELDEGADFDTLAKENSEDTGSASQGGLITGVTRKDYVKEFVEAALELETGKYTTTPVKTSYGYHIILKVNQNEKPSLEDTIDYIKETLVNEKLTSDQTLSVTAWDEIRKEHNMTINDDTIKNDYNKVMDSYKK